MNNQPLADDAVESGRQAGNMAERVAGVARVVPEGRHYGSDSAEELNTNSARDCPAEEAADVFPQVVAHPHFKGWGRIGNHDVPFLSISASSLITCSAGTTCFICSTISSSLGDSTGGRSSHKIL